MILRITQEPKGNDMKIEKTGGKKPKKPSIICMGWVKEDAVRALNLANQMSS